MAKYTSKHHRDVQLNVGNLVYVPTDNFLLACQLYPRLAPRWVGPYTISAVISSAAYHVEFLAEYGRVHLISHVSYLRPHVGPALPQPLAPLLLDNIVAGEYEVEDILDSKLGQSGMKYLVKWVGYPVFESMWERAKHLANAQDILNKYLPYHR